MCLPLPLPKFLEWYRELGKLKVFWAKPFSKLVEARDYHSHLALKVEWTVRGKPREALLIALKDPPQLPQILEELSLSYPGPILLVVDEEISPPLPQRYIVDRHSIFYFWFIEELSLLEPSRKVEVELHERWDSTVEEQVSRVQRQSWGFYVPPRAGDHLVVIAKLDGEAVGSTYLNVNNANLDYGVHVARSHWRQRIGTRILHEAAQQAKIRGFPYFSVVRVLRRVDGAASDRRALGFYRANNPSAKFKVLRVVPKP